MPKDSSRRATPSRSFAAWQALGLFVGCEPDVAIQGLLRTHGKSAVLAEAGQLQFGQGEESGCLDSAARDRVRANERESPASSLETASRVGRPGKTT